MLTALVASIVGLVGVLLGGGVRAWESQRARKSDAAALLSALVAEIEAITRLIQHRQFIPALIQYRDLAQLQVSAGNGGDPAMFLTISLTQNYFAVFEASLAKLGLLSPYEADRIVRFYTFLKATMENYDARSPFQQGVDANSAVEILNNDLMLLHTVAVLGNHIASFRPVVPPPGVADPFTTLTAPVQPALPLPQPALADQEAGSAPKG